MGGAGRSGRARSAFLGAFEQASGDLIDDNDGEHDHALGDDDDRGRDVLTLQGRAGAVEEREQHCCESNPDGRVAA